MPFHFSMQRRTFLRRFFCLLRILLSFFDGNASCQDLVQQHFLDDCFPRDAIFFPISLAAFLKKRSPISQHSFFDRSKISRIIVTIK